MMSRKLNYQLKTRMIFPRASSAEGPSFTHTRELHSLHNVCRYEWYTDIVLEVKRAKVKCH